MLKKIVIITYILLFYNFNSFADENQKNLKVGLLAPFSGEYKDMGQSIMLSLQLALDEINDEKIKIFPRDSGYNNPEKLKQSLESLREENIRLKSEVRKLRVINSKTSSQELELLELRELLKVLPESKNKIVTGRAITSPGGVLPIQF